MDVSRIDPSCIFKKKTKRLNWSKIDDADLNSVHQNLNISVLQNNITNLTYCDIHSEMKNMAISDERDKKKLTKAFVLTQLIMEYLMVILSMAQVIAEKDAQIEKFKKIERLSINEGLPMKQNCGPILTQILDEVQNIKALNVNLCEVVSRLKTENRNVPTKMEETGLKPGFEACSSTNYTKEGKNLAAFVSIDNDLSLNSNKLENVAETLNDEELKLKDIIGQLSCAYFNITPKSIGHLKLNHTEMESKELDQKLRDHLLNENLDPDSSSSLKEFYPDSNAFRVNRSCSVGAGSSSSSSAESFIALGNREPSDFSLTPIEDKPAVD